MPPRETDVQAADALIVGLPAGMTPGSEECSGFYDLLAKLGAEGKLSGKVGRGGWYRSDPDAIARVLSAAGLTVVTPNEGTRGDGTEAAIALGRRVVAAAESSRRASI